MKFYILLGILLFCFKIPSGWPADDIPENRVLYTKAHQLMCVDKKFFTMKTAKAEKFLAKNPAHCMEMSTWLKVDILGNKIKGPQGYYVKAHAERSTIVGYALLADMLLEAPIPKPAPPTTPTPAQITRDVMTRPDAILCVTKANIANIDEVRLALERKDDSWLKSLGCFRVKAGVKAVRIEPDLAEAAQFWRVRVMADDGDEVTAWSTPNQFVLPDGSDIPLR